MKILITGSSLLQHVDKLPTHIISAILQIDQKVDELIQRQDRIFQELELSRQRENEEVELFKTDAEELIYKVNEVSEKIMDFEKNKRNNLIMFGIPNDSHESPSSLDIKVELIGK